jgi:hypothetical protein
MLKEALEFSDGPGNGEEGGFVRGDSQGGHDG